MHPVVVRFVVLWKKLYLEVLDSLRATAFRPNFRRLLPKDLAEATNYQNITGSSSILALSYPQAELNSIRTL